MSRKSAAFNARFKELFNSTSGKQIYVRALANEEQFEDYLPYAFLIGDDKTIQTKQLQLIQCVRLDGINAATSADSAIDDIKNLFASIISNADPQFSYYIHKVSKHINYEPSKITTNDFAAELDEAWLEHLTKTGSRDVSITITLISSSDILMKVRGLFGKLREMSRDYKTERNEAHHADITDRISSLNELSSLIVSTFGHLNTRILTASSGELLGFLESIGCGTETKAFPLNEHAVLARSVANYRPTMVGTDIHISGGSVGNRIGRIFTIKDYPRMSYAGIFDEMKLPLDVVITNSFTPISDDKAKELLRRTLAQRASVNDAAVTDQEQMKDGRDRIASGLEKLGYHHMTVAIFADSKEVIDRASAEVRSVAQEVGAKVITEAFAGVGHYFAQWPANADYRSRTGLISNYAFAGIASLHRTPTGVSAGSLPWVEPISAFPTMDGGLYNFSFHPSGSSKAEPPAAHAAMFGNMGSGKTVLINFLTAQARRQGVQTFLFDYRKGMETAVKAMSGTYTTISPNQATGLNPLYSETDPQGKAWLTDWLTALLDRDDKKFSAVQRQAISDAVNQNASSPDNLRNFKHFPDLFSHIDDGGDLQQRVREWCLDGRFGWVFGENEIENFSLNNQVMGFDMTNVLDAGDEKEKTAILGYLFRLIEKKLQARTPTFIIIDEAWSALNTNYFAAKLQDWLVTARKLNAVVMLVTQFPSQLTNSKLGDSMLQAIRTQIVLPNRNADASNYASIKLNDRELHTVLNTPAGMRVALIRNDTESVTVNTNLAALGEYLSIIGGGNTGEKALEQYKAGKSND